MMKFNRIFPFALLICAFLVLLSAACSSGDESETSTRVESQTPTETVIPTQTPVPPSASFSIDVESGSAPLTVRFTDTSAGESTQVEWDFGDGTTSNDASPSHDYTIAGTYDVKLTISGPGGADASAMPGLITVQAGPPMGLVVSPANPVVAIQETLGFTAIVVDEFGNALPGTPTWTVTGVGGSITDDGIFTAGIAADTFTDIVTAAFQSDDGEIVANVSVSVEAGPVAQVSVEPAEATLEIGGSQPFILTVLDEFGNPVNDFLSSWSVSSDAGAIDADGVLTSGTKAGVFLGTVQVDVVKGQDRFSASADVIIKSDPLASIEVSPSFARVEDGGSQMFEATALDQFGNSIDGVALLWTATGGEISQSGSFTAVEQGSGYEVTASASVGEKDAAGSADVYILSSIDLYLGLGSDTNAAHSFAEPILAAVSGAPTDFEDGFSTSDNGWTFDVGAGVATPQGTMEIQDGVMRISNLVGQIIINGGAWTHSKDFVLEIDTRVAQGDLSTIQKFFFHLAGSNYFNIHLGSRDQSWQYIKGTNAGGGTLDRGTGGSPIGETTRYKLVVRGSEAVIYLNDDAILYLNDSDLDNSGMITFGCLTSIEAICEFDNVKFWDLANIPDLP